MWLPGSFVSLVVDFVTMGSIFSKLRGQSAELEKVQSVILRRGVRSAQFKRGKDIRTGRKRKRAEMEGEEEEEEKGSSEYASIDFMKTYALWETMRGNYSGGGRVTRHDMIK